MTTTHHSALTDTLARTTHAASSPAFGAVLTKLTVTARDPAATVARVALGFVLWPHGLQHNLGWFGGYGFSGTLGWMTGTLGFPAPLAALGLIIELVAPLFLLVGLGGRATAALLFGFMAFAASTHLQNGFFMNWYGRLTTGQEGYEYHLLALGLAAVVAVKGMGALSLDRALFARRVTSAAS
jgi:putative oxidoreductase